MLRTAAVLAFVGCCSAFSSMLMCDPRPSNEPPALREDAAGMRRRNVMKVGAATSFIAAASEVSTPLARSASAAKSTAAAADGMKNMAPMFEFVETNPSMFQELVAATGVRTPHPHAPVVRMA